MESIKNWGMLLLFVCAGSLIYCFLIPNGNISKTVKSVISVLVLTSVCSPLISAVGELSSFIPDEKAKENEIRDYSDEYIALARESVNTVIANTVKEFTSVAYKTDIGIDKTEDGSINIEYVGIIFQAKPEKEKELREAIYSQIGLMPDIKVEYTE